jgi:carbon-monoxide dehydrogenase medium subunit
MRRFEYFAPQSLAEAIALFGEKGEGGRALAGGTDLVPQIKEGGKIPRPAYVVSLRRLPELRGIEFSERDGLRVGAGVTMAELAESPVVRERYRALADGAGVVGSVQTMNMATVGGNVCNAAPSADTAPALLAYEAVAVIAGPGGERELPLAEFWRELTRPRSSRAGCAAADTAAAPNTGGVYARRTPRKQMDIAVVGVAVLLTIEGDRVERARVALGAVAPTPIRARETEAALEGQTASEALFAKAAEAAAAGRQIGDKARRGGFAAWCRNHLGRCLPEAARRARG